MRDKEEEETKMQDKEVNRDQKSIKVHLKFNLMSVEHLLQADCKDITQMCVDGGGAAPACFPCTLCLAGPSTGPHAPHPSAVFSVCPHLQLQWSII